VAVAVGNPMLRRSAGCGISTWRVWSWDLVLCAMGYDVGPEGAATATGGGSHARARTREVGFEVGGIEKCDDVLAGWRGEGEDDMFWCTNCEIVCKC